MYLCNSNLASVSVHCVCDPEIIRDEAQDLTQGLNKSIDICGRAAGILSPAWFLLEMSSVTTEDDLG